MGWRVVRLVAVMARAELFGLDVRPLLAGFTGRRGGRGWALVSPSLGGPTSAAIDRVRVRGPIRSCGGALPMAGWHSRVPIEWQVLVKFMDVKGLHVVDDLTAQLGDVHVAEINVLSTTFHEASAFVLQLLLAPRV